MKMRFSVVPLIMREILLLLARRITPAGFGSIMIIKKRIEFYFKSDSTISKLLKNISASRCELHII